LYTITAENTTAAGRHTEDKKKRQEPKFLASLNREASRLGDARSRHVGDPFFGFSPEGEDDVAVQHR